jgi:hypothetical protein
MFASGAAPPGMHRCARLVLLAATLLLVGAVWLNAGGFLLHWLLT